MLSFLHSVLRSQRDFASTVLRFKSYKTPSFHSPNCPAPPYHMQRCLTHIPLSLALPYMPLFDLKKINITFVLIFFFKSQITYSKISILWYPWLSLIWGQTAEACLGRPEDQGAIALRWSVAMMSGSWWMNAPCPYTPAAHSGQRLVNTTAPLLHLTSPLPLHPSHPKGWQWYFLPGPCAFTKMEISHKVHRHVSSIHNAHAGMDELIRKLCWAK